MILLAWFMLSMAVSVVAGWVIGRYGWTEKLPSAGEKLIALHLVKTNQKELRK